MATPLSPNNSVRRHARNISHPMPRRSTKGPLDAVDDPLAESQTRPDATRAPSSAAVEAVQADAPLTPNSPSPTEIAPARPSTAHIDLRFLLNRDSYHQIATDDIPTAFAESERQPPPSASLPELLEHGHFRKAAETALDELLKSDAKDVKTISRLLYTRLACLVLISRPDFAADEALPLTDFLSRNSPGAKDLLAFIPWELRLLLVRLQSIVAADGGRRAIMALYALSGEVRINIKEARASDDDAAIDLWSVRLRDLGLRVADSFVEMGELETAHRYLETLTGVDGDEINYRKALLRVRVGDVEGSARSVQAITSSERRQSMDALLKTADGNWDAAVQVWQDLAQKSPEDELLRQNAAVCLVYTGRLVEARRVLENLARDTPTFPTLLFNLSTVYELCTERAIARKTEAAQALASKSPTFESGGWERTNAEFKL